MPNSKIEITVFLDGKPFAVRFWPVVPRVGDSIGLGVKPNEFIAKVNRVVWLNGQTAAVDLYCTWS
jgi:hypothetical protein